MKSNNSTPIFKATDYLFFDKIDSTNNFAKEWLRNHKLDSNCVIATNEQFSGRGHQSNKWLTQPGKNLIFTIVKSIQLPVKNQYTLSQAVCLGIIDFLTENDIEATVKWPNDIYCGDMKIAGILVENILRGTDIRQSIIGVGLNANQIVFPPEAGRPCSMQQLTGMTYDLKKLLISCSNSIGNRVLSINYESINDEFHRHLYNINKLQHFQTKNGKPFAARIQYVDDDGRLTIKTKNGEIKKFFFKEIEYIFA